MVKAGVIEEFITPLLKHLERAEKEARKIKLQNPDIDKFKEVQREIEIAKFVLGEAKKWEGDLIKTFGFIERHLDRMLDVDVTRMTSELDVVLQKTKIINEMIKSLKKLPDAKPPEHPSVQPRSEVGESSKSNTPDKGDETDEIAYFDEEKLTKLNPKLVLCSLSLCVFPENSKMKKRVLIYWWIGLELVQAEWMKTAEDIGEIIFNDLVSLGILIPLQGTKGGVVDGCVVEPMVHKQIISAAEKRKFIRGRSYYSTGGPYNFLVCRSETNQSKLSTLINVDENYLKSDFILKRLKANNNLCGIQLGQCSGEARHIEVDKTDFLKDLKPTLTYLSLQGISRITELPDSIGNLENLIVLDLRACHNLETLPQKIKSMNKLTHLDVSMCYLLDHLPKWVGSLSNLEVLKGFVIGSSRNRDRCRLMDLANLVKLRKLTMTIGRESVVVSEELQCLKNKTQLRSLTIIWGADAYNNITKKISPPENLEKLDFRYYPQDEMPEWFSHLKGLKRLYIRGGNLKKLVDEMATIEIVRLRFLKNFEMPLHKLSSLFPNLTYLEPVECAKMAKMVKMNTMDGFWKKERDGPLSENLLT